MVNEAITYGVLAAIAVRSDVSYMAEFIPTSTLKFLGAKRQKILAYLTSRDGVFS